MEPRYKIGDVIKIYTNIVGTVTSFWYSEEIKQWMYKTKDQEFITREDNVRPSKTEPLRNNYMGRKRGSKNIKRNT